MHPAIGEPLRFERRRRPDVDVLRRIGKSGWHYAHDGVLLAVEHDFPANQAAVAAESSLPQAVAEQDDARPAGLILLRQE